MSWQTVRATARRPRLPGACQQVAPPLWVLFFCKMGRTLFAPRLVAGSGEEI